MPEPGDDDTTVGAGERLRGRGHRAAPHTADVAVEAWAPTRAGCLEELVSAFVELFADTSGAVAVREIPFEVAAADDEDVVVALLEDVLVLADANGLVPVDVAVEEEDDGTFSGRFVVAAIADVSPEGAVPKGISRSGLELADAGGVWRSRVIVDV